MWSTATACKSIAECPCREAGQAFATVRRSTLCLALVFLPPPYYIAMEPILMAKELMSKDEIRKIRLALGMSQTEFADAVGVNQATVSLWESGLRSPSGSATILIRQIQASKKSRKKSPAMVK